MLDQEAGRDKDAATVTICRVRDDKAPPNDPLSENVLSVMRSVPVL